MAEEGTKRDGAKRKFDEMTDEDNNKQSSATKEDESATKKIKSTPPGDQPTSGVVEVNSENKEKTAPLSNDVKTNGSGDQVTKSTAAPATGQKSDKQITLVAGGIYRVQCPELGDFTIIAGASGEFRVKAATLIITNTNGTVMFPDPALTLTDGVEVEVKNTGTGTTSVTVLSDSPKAPAPPQNQNWLTRLFAVKTPPSSAATKVEPTSMQVVGFMDDFIQVNGSIPTVVTAHGGRLINSGTAAVTVQGSLQSVENKATGTVEVNGNVTGGVWQAGSGSVKITGDLNGHLSNSGGGSVEVMGQFLGSVGRSVRNYHGRVSFGTGPNNGGITRYFRSVTIRGVSIGYGYVCGEVTIYHYSH